MFSVRIIRTGNQESVQQIRQINGKMNRKMWRSITRYVALKCCIDDCDYILDIFPNKTGYQVSTVPLWDEGETWFYFFLDRYDYNRHVMVTINGHGTRIKDATLVTEMLIK